MDTTTTEFLDDLEDLSSAEDFLSYFGIEFDQRIVHVNRLHILQRFHDYLAKNTPAGETADYAQHRHWLATAYEDFVTSTAQAEKVFKVFRMNEPQTVFVPLAEAFK